MARHMDGNLEKVTFAIAALGIKSDS